jgi:RNA polymerase sigma-70 factor (ECF subfamily)
MRFRSVFGLNPIAVQIANTDTESLLDLARLGDTEAFCELCRAYETPLLRQAMSLSGNETLAEDLAQDTLVEAWKSLRRYNGRCQFFTWLCAILLNRYRNTLRQRHSIFTSAPSTPPEDAQEVFNNLADAESLPDETMLAREQASVILQCINLLKPKHQQVIYLRFYVDDSLEGIAAALHCSVGTVKSRLFRALDKLRAMNALQSARSERKIGTL